MEDHPLDYGDFEGVIGKGRYGAGAVIVWDTGSYENLAGRASRWPRRCERGHVSVWLEGQKLRGGYTLQRTRGGDKPQWLLIKRRDEEADARRNPVSTQPRVGAQRADGRAGGRRGGDDERGARPLPEDERRLVRRRGARARPAR